MILLYVVILFVYGTNGQQEIYRASNCYGDGSAGTRNTVDISCSTGYIFIHDVIAATKPSSLNCPAEEHATTPADKTLCCTYSDTDCLVSFSGDRSSYLACNYQASCSDLLIIRDSNACDWTIYNSYSNYMTIEYYCVPPGYTNGPCNTTADCNDPSAMCDKALCKCVDGYTTYDAFDKCWQDGALNGSCTGAVGCQDAYTMCNFMSGRCICFTGYIPVDGDCIQGGYNGGFCTDTADCTDPHAMCDTSVCICEEGYQAYEDFDDCWKDGTLFGDCTGSNTCTDANTVCDVTSGRCVCDTGYTDYQAVCYADGELHGYCNVNNDCAALTECVNNTCECINGYTDINNQCIQDGSVGGVCEVTVDCQDDNAICDVTGTPSLCVCTETYTDIDNTCIKDGDLNGVCDSVSDCRNTNTECRQHPTIPGISVCECVSGYTDIGGTCMEDDKVGGRCTGSGTGSCLDDNTECSENGVCVCIDNYQEVNDQCLQVGSNGGVCNNDQTCDDVNAVCGSDISAQCNNMNCQPGICECKTGYSVGYDGTCIEDGALGGICSRDRDCVDVNANCDRTLYVCVCSITFTQYQGVCVEDGTLFGDCTGSNTCTDANTVCDVTSGRCVCDTGFTDYQVVCYADGELHGHCNMNNDCAASTECVNNKCECINGYTDINNQCIQDGAIGGVCTVDDDCNDDNTVCNSSRSPSVCQCENIFTDINDACIKDGELGGVCNTHTDCTDGNTECIQHSTIPGISVCECVSGYTDIGGACMEDDRIGGSCSGSGTGSCVDAKTECSENDVCVCIDKYQEVNDLCLQDGSSGGVCNTDQSCDDVNAVCGPDTSEQCNNANCQPGVCECKTGYNVGHGSVCIEDGTLGGICSRDRDCVDVNANCDRTLYVCVCSITFTQYQGVCVEDGYPTGNCLPDNTCIDQHSICIDGVCVCNDARHYTVIDGACQREDNYVNGDCSTNTCLDQHAACVDSVCRCTVGYEQVNGVCTLGDVSFVTSCDGDSPYNQLVPDCGEGTASVVHDTYQRVKPVSLNCPPQMNTYTEAVFTQCCSPSSTDCRLYGSGADACTNADLTAGYTTYNVVEYSCVPDGSVIAIDNDSEVTSGTVYLTNPAGNTGITTETCSVLANCHTEITVDGSYLNLNQDGNTCTQYLNIDDVVIDCYNSSSLPYRVKSPYFTIILSNPDNGGQFLLHIEGANSNSEVTLSCGSNFKSDVTIPTNTCDPQTGKSTGEDEDQNNTAVLIGSIIAGLVALGIIAAGVIFRKSIKKKLCHVKDDEKGIVESTPGNRKFTRGAPEAVVATGLLPLINGPTPMNEKFKRSNSGFPVIPVVPPNKLPPLSASMKSIHKPAPLEKRMTITDMMHNKEQMEAEKQEKQHKKDKNHDGKKKKKAKKLRKARIGIMASQNFKMAGQSRVGGQPGTFRPNENFYKTPTSVDVPYVHPLPSNHPAPHPPPERLPAVREKSNFNMSMNGGPPVFQNTMEQSVRSGTMQSSIRSVASLSSTVNAFRNFNGRQSILEIKSVDDPADIEEASVDEC